MLLKSADDKSKRVTLLESLQHSPNLDRRQKDWIAEELHRLKTGTKGEADAAYYLDQYFKDGQNHVVMHDLRLVCDGDVAQIDHLIINRAAGMYLVETKNFNGSVDINDAGEFTVIYGRKRVGVPSPLEQSHRHARVLTKLLERLGVQARTGGAPEFHHVVMFHTNAVINRPSAKVFDTSNVIKADQFPSWHAKYVDKTLGFGAVLKAAANMRSLDTIREWGEMLMRQHRPVNPLELPDFMAPKEAAPAPIVTAPASDGGKKRLICDHCGSKITFPEGKFCWNNEVRFKGGQYCREHQGLFS